MSAFIFMFYLVFFFIPLGINHLALLVKFYVNVI